MDIILLLLPLPLGNRHHPSFIAVTFRQWISSSFYAVALAHILSFPLPFADIIFLLLPLPLGNGNGSISQQV